MSECNHERGRGAAVVPAFCGGRVGLTWVGLALGVFGASGCVDVAQMAAPDHGLLGQTVSVFDEASVDLQEARPFVGVTLEESLGSLDAMDFVAGLDVVKVDKGSPAAKVGVRAGDRLVEANGAELLSLDQWQAVVDGLSSSVPLRLSVERAGGISEVTVAFETARNADMPAPVRFAERWKLRAEFESVAGLGGVQVVLRAILTGSPLLETDVAVGDTIAAMDGEDIQSAAALARALADRDFGEEVRLRYTPAMSLAAEAGASDAPNPSPQEVRVALWSPPRYVTRLQVPLLFDYQRDPVRDDLTFSFIDFWLFAIYDYQREAESRRHRLLYFFEYSSGVGELSDETVVSERLLPAAEGAP